MRINLHDLVFVSKTTLCKMKHFVVLSCKTVSRYFSIIGMSPGYGFDRQSADDTEVAYLYTKVSTFRIQSISTRTDR